MDSHIRAETVSRHGRRLHTTHEIPTNTIILHRTDNFQYLTPITITDIFLIVNSVIRKLSMEGYHMEESIIYQRIMQLIEERGITKAQLEQECGLSNSSIAKWQYKSIPKSDILQRIALYFHVTTDYLLGITDIRESAEQIIDDPDIISIQRARSQMSERDKTKMMNMLKAGFDEAFKNS